MSCNGCRVLRKGCSETCILRSCLQWIESAEAQGHATVFVAKFFGRAGLMAFLSGVPENERPGVFQSLLYEACGRTVNPVYGAVGLLWSGNWNICEAAVETVLRGGTIRPLSQPTIPLLNHALPLPSKPLQSTQPASPCKRVLTENFCFASEKKSRTLGQVSVGDDGTSSYNLLNKIWTSNPDFLKDGFDNGDEEKKDEDAGSEQIVTPEKTMEANGSSRALRAIPNQIALDMELDLTLSPYLSRKKQMKADGSVSSPNSAISVNSEGSLTSLDTIDFPIFQRHFRPPPLKEKHELLNFLV